MEFNLPDGGGHNEHNGVTIVEISIICVMQPFKLQPFDRAYQLRQTGVVKTQGQ